VNGEVKFIEESLNPAEALAKAGGEGKKKAVTKSKKITGEVEILVERDTIGKCCYFFLPELNEANRPDLRTKAVCTESARRKVKSSFERLTQPVNQNFNFTCYFFGFGDGLFLPLTPRLRQGFGGISTTLQ